jgi:hypothetical protein
MLGHFGFIRCIRSFHDLPLWAKVLVAPAACLTAGIAVAVSIWLGAAETEGRLAEVANNALPTAAARARLLDGVDTIQTKAMRALVWQQAGVAQATIDALVKDIGNELNTLRTAAAAMVAGRTESDTDLPRLKSIAASRRNMPGNSEMRLTWLRIRRLQSGCSAAPMRRSRRCAATSPA